jgi:hypothetical protein
MSMRKRRIGEWDVFYFFDFGFLYIPKEERGGAKGRKESKGTRLEASRPSNSQKCCAMIEHGTQDTHDHDTEPYVMGEGMEGRRNGAMDWPYWSVA